MKLFKILAIHALSDINRSASPRVLNPIKYSACILNSMSCIANLISLPSEPFKTSNKLFLLFTSYFNVTKILIFHLIRLDVDLDLGNTCTGTMVCMFLKTQQHFEEH